MVTEFFFRSPNFEETWAFLDRRLGDLQAAPSLAQVQFCPNRNRQYFVFKPRQPPGGNNFSRCLFMQVPGDVAALLGGLATTARNMAGMQK